MFFSAAFPAAAILSWFNNVIEIRLDANSVLTNEPRPTAERKGGIGVWFEIIELMSFAAIVINALIFALTSDSIGAGIHNFCRFGFQDIDVTVDPFTLSSLLRTARKISSAKSGREHWVKGFVMIDDVAMRSGGAAYFCF